MYENLGRPLVCASRYSGTRTGPTPRGGSEQRCRIEGYALRPQHCLWIDTSRFVD